MSISFAFWNRSVIFFFKVDYLVTIIRLGFGKFALSYFVYILCYETHLFVYWNKRPYKNELNQHNRMIYKHKKSDEIFWIWRILRWIRCFGEFRNKNILTKCRLMFSIRKLTCGLFVLCQDMFILHSFFLHTKHKQWATKISWQVNRKTKIYKRKTIEFVICQLFKLKVNKIE